MAAIPFIIYFMGTGANHSLLPFTSVAIAMLLFSAVSFVARFALLGNSDAKSVLLIDLGGVITKFIVAYVLVFIGYAVTGLLIGLLTQFLVVAFAALIQGSKSFRFNLNWKFGLEVLREGLINMPAKLARTFIFSLIVVLLAFIGINSSEIGVFYVALMISVIAGSLVSSMAYMGIPASSISNTDLSSGSVRIGLSLTAPIIAALIVAPGFVLSIIGKGSINFVSFIDKHFPIFYSDDGNLKVQ